ncbi:hypothetical protein ACWEO1_22730 [Kitasatospora cineracea]
MTDLTYRAARTDTPDQPISHGHHTTWPGTTQQLADETAARLRTTRPDAAGALTVHVWPTREDEHYQQPVPASAAAFHYPAPSTHWGRSWAGTPIEDACPCPQAPCGLVDSATVDQACGQHAAHRAQTRRQAHPADQCPAITYGHRYGTLHRTLTTHLPPAHAEEAIAELAALLTAAAQMHHALGTVQAITVLRQHGADPDAIDLLLAARTGQEG